MDPRQGFDGACLLGPWVETELDLSALSLRSTVNGDLRQDGTTADMLREGSVSVSQAMTLLPGDVGAYRHAGRCGVTAAR